jgi:hypothetical protein
MRESRSSGSVEGVMSNRDPYSDRYANPVDTNHTCPRRAFRVSGAALSKLEC